MSSSSSSSSSSSTSSKSSPRLLYLSIWKQIPLSSSSSSSSDVNSHSPDEKSVRHDTIRLCHYASLESFSYFVRGTAGDAIKFACRTIAERVKIPCRQSISSGDKQLPIIVHSLFNSDGLGVTAVTTENYDPRVAFVLLNKCLKEYQEFDPKWSEKSVDYNGKVTPPTIKELFSSYSNSTDNDLLNKISAQIIEVKGLVNQNIQQLLSNGETMEGLLEKSGELEEQSKKFLKQAKKTNSCCRL